ncbi:beta-ketoacyl synthase chain length factor [Acanthopleuribacter pedis]|uniref:Beta-ketoacyl synthase chain length factor n=1 Tax=Acanthopleuribacter pedis TaxID=442870 RepID=A0A8J7QAE4_9BACT|nr:beta-ketoacyl synthase chain length factor [Acanthopleuribacter pedis]MBO1320655.1 beta-ketoacyl synthase chain length factor [Acanthopleuribacter pedis]
MSQTASHAVGSESAATHPLKLVGWRAWAEPYPEHADFEAFLRGAQPPIADGAKPKAAAVPARLRRRCTLVSKMVLETSLPLVDQYGVDLTRTNLLFGSRNSEINILRNLLNDIEGGEALSPTAFGNSVHHTASGYFGLVCKHQGVSRTISANQDTLTCCMLETVDLLRRDPEAWVLMVFAEEMPLPPFDQMLASPPFPFAVAMLWRRGGPDDPRFSMPALGPVTECPSPTLFAFLSWYLSEKRELHQAGSFGGCSWLR